jgi:hypothetical protein
MGFPLPVAGGVISAGARHDQPSIFCGGCCPLTDTAYAESISDAGFLQWSLTHVTPGFSSTIAYQAVRDSRSNLYLCGQTGWHLEEGWAWVAKFLPDRSLAWTRTLHGYHWATDPSGGCFHLDYAFALSLSPDETRLYVVGKSDDAPLPSPINGFIAAIELEPPIPTTTPTGTGPPLLGRIGAALDVNAFDPQRGESVTVRVFPGGVDPFDVKVFTASGRPVRTLGSPKPLGSGQWGVTWDGKDAGGGQVARGVYIILVRGGSLEERLKVVVRPSRK